MSMRIVVTTAIVLIPLCCPPAASAQEHGAIAVSPLARGLYLLTTDQGDYTTNSLAFVGDDGVLLVDTQAEEYADELKRVVDGFGKGAPRFIINTHGHVEHIGGNAVFGPEPVVIAHDRLPAKLRSGSYLFDEFPAATFPDITLDDSLTLHFNGETIRVLAMAGSHDDNEIIVHFTSSKVVHLSSLTNGFNFPSVDSDGDALAFAPLIAKVMALLPEDVVIVSGHNAVGSWKDLGPYHEMLVATTAAVRDGLARGLDLATLQKEDVLARWKGYAGSYVSTDRWTEYLVEAIRGERRDRKPLFERLYRVWKERGAEAAVADYLALRREQPDADPDDQATLVIIGDKLVDHGRDGEAVPFLEASLSAFPGSRYATYAYYDLAVANRRLGRPARARELCRKALEANPEFDRARRLLAELGDD